jgi:predicted AAA+ superfamily ATPase
MCQSLSLKSTTVSHYLQLFTSQFKNLQSVKHIYKNNKIYTIYTGLVQSRLCAADYPLLTSNLVYHGSLRHLNSHTHDRRQV